MNDGDSQRLSEQANEERVSGALGEVDSRLTPVGEPEELVERVLARGTGRLFSCDSPLGEVYVGVSESGVRLLGRAASPEEFARRYRERFGQLLSWGADETTRRLARRVAAALAGEKAEVPADLSGTTPFQRRVLEVVAGIPRGEVRPYGWVAHEAGSPKASRAVGSVMASNPVPLLVPCHRVVRNDGTTGKYAFGAGEKVGLLEGEGVPVGELAGAPYLATPTTGVFCHATCRNARRIKPENRQRFRSAEAATAAGYRPCKACRPVVDG
ncbi:MAG: methylated-DNA--[protein]-cysteine S-methyltransferase [Rubrobacter sp.]|nr:methylated-DNA--[protein]-cysteine S-methyltransferase [Rubrobacter sp.]